MSFCEENEEKWGPFLAGEVESEERARLEEHLESCQACQGKVSFMRGLKGLVSKAESSDYPADVHSRLLAALEKEKQQSSKVVEADFNKKPAGKRFAYTRILQYAAAAAVVCLIGVGSIQGRYGQTAPDAVASLVEHHDTCWHIQPSEGRDAQFDEWVEKLGEMPPKPTVSPELVAFDQRECPAGEVRAGHLLYNKGEQKVSVYILPAQEFMTSYGKEKLSTHKYDEREIVLKRKGDWVYGVVAQMPEKEIERLVDTEHLAILRQYLATRGVSQG